VAVVDQLLGLEVLNDVRARLAEQVLVDDERTAFLCGRPDLETPVVGAGERDTAVREPVGGIPAQHLLCETGTYIIENLKTKELVDDSIPSLVRPVLGAGGTAL
jgi:hypothetical protein